MRALLTCHVVVAALSLVVTFLAVLAVIDLSPGGYPGAGTTRNGDVDVHAARTQQFRELISRAGVYYTFPPPSPCNTTDCPPLKVGIIGAGISGMYAALLLQSVNVDYEILEADGRVGGRIFTHYFDPEAWNAATPAEPAYYNYYASYPPY
jgi:hypothetical protein